MTRSTGLAALAVVTLLLCPGIRSAQASPIVNLTGTDIGPPYNVTFTVLDAVVGIQSINVLQSINAVTVVPAFAPGTIATLLVHGTTIDQTQLAFISLCANNTLGESTCKQWQLDPVHHTVIDTTPTRVPEPATLVLLGTGAVAAYRRRRGV